MAYVICIGYAIVIGEQTGSARYLDCRCYGTCDRWPVSERCVDAIYTALPFESHRFDAGRDSRCHSTNCDPCPKWACATWLDRTPRTPRQENASALDPRRRGACCRFTKSAANSASADY